MFYIQLVCICIFCVLELNAQSYTDNVQALIAQLNKTAKSDTNAVLLMHKISSAYARSTVLNDSCVVWANAALQLSKNLNYKNGIAYSYFQLGRTSIAISEFPQAIENFYNALDYFLRVHNAKGIADVNLQVGVIMFNQKNYDDAMSNFKASYNFYKTGTDSFRISMLSYLMGLCHFEKREFEEAYPMLEGALKIKELIADSTGIGECNMAIGNLYLELKNYQRSKKYFEKAYSYFEEGNKDGIIISAIGLAKIALADSNYALAGKYFTDAYKKSIEVNRKSMIRRTTQPLYEYYALTHDYHNAYAFQKIYRTLVDSIYNFENAQAIAVLNARIEAEKKQSEIQLLEKKHQQDVIRNYFLIALAFLGILFAYIVYRRFNYKKQSEKVLAQSNAEIKQLMIELKSAEEQLIQTEKMASLGRLTSGIAHELRNPMNFITNFSQETSAMTKEFIETKSAEEKKQVAEDLKANFSRINKHSKRADRIIKSMLLHSRIGEGQAKEVDINLMCNEFIELAYNGMKSAFPGFECNIFKNLDMELPQVKIIPQDVIRILLNLLSNAFYTVREKTNKIEGDYIPVVVISTVFEKGHVLLSVKDNGMGIPKQYYTRIFTPFFTTKPSGQGIGLGLNICQQVIKSYNGKIVFSTLEGEGTVFTVFIPTALA